MKKVSLMKASLLGSASALGYNWIYDRKYLLEKSKGNDLLFKPIDHNAYKEAKKSFDVYPDFKLGDVDFMGETLFLFHKFITTVSNHTPLGWRKTMYNHIHKSGIYEGYIESFGKDLLSQIKDEDANETEPNIYTDHIDKQLVGPVLLLASYDNLGVTDKVKETLEFSKVLTGYSNTENFLEMLNYVLTNITTENKITVLKDSLKYAPKEYLTSLKKAISMTDINEFIKKHAGVACGLEQSFPLIYFIVAQFETWEDALRENVILGGASCARGIFISAIFNLMDGINPNYENLLLHKV